MSISKVTISGTGFAFFDTENLAFCLSAGKKGLLKVHFSSMFVIAVYVNGRLAILIKGG